MFIDDPEEPSKPRQFMILWSTKYTEDMKVNEKRWSQGKPPKRVGNKLTFNGMTAAWWFDGKKMYDPILLEQRDFQVSKQGKEGELRPVQKQGDYSFHGNPDRYLVNLVDERNDFRFELTPWNDYLQEHRFKENSYTKKYSYNISKIYGMKLQGEIGSEKVQGTGYFQRVNINSPVTPWYWALVHCETGSFIHAFNVYIGPQMFRSKEKPRSKLDWGDIFLSRSLMFYHRESNTEHKFRRKSISVSHHFKNGTPVIRIKGEDDEKRLHMEIEAYSRAVWRIQQPRKLGMKCILYYNEFPGILRSFDFETKDGSIRVRKEDLGNTSSHFEHAWGKLL